MADLVEMVQLSPTMEEGLVVAWMKGEGDRVATGDILAEVETDKATMEMESYFDGTLLRILAPAGTAAKVGTALAIIGEPGEDISGLVGGRGAGGSAAPANTAPVGERGDAAAVPSAAASVAAPGRILSSPVARKLAAASGVPLETIRGSGPNGRIVKQDVIAAKAAPASAQAVPPPAGPAPAPRKPSAPTVAPVTPVAPTTTAASTAASTELASTRVVPLSPMRKAIARNLTAAWQAPAFMLTRDVDMDAAVRLRAEINASLEADGVDTRVSVNDIVIKAAARALIEVPEMNAAYDGDQLILYGAADIGVAVALDGGLITPVVRGAERRSLVDIAQSVRDLAGRARAKKLQPDEYTGATFSISNLGMFGIDAFTAVLNPPAAGILAVGQTRRVPVVADDGNVVVAQRMTVTLTCDHRAVDGAVGARFLQRFARGIAAPAALLARG